MKANVGGIDRVLRIAAGVAIIAGVPVLTGAYNPWMWVGLIPLATGLVGFCPFYPLIGLNTCSTQEPD